MPVPEPAPDTAPDTDLMTRMRLEWDERARENARHYAATARTNWTDEEYFESGRRNVYYEILTDLGNVCQGKSPKRMKVLEIGCGSGRMTRALSEIFGQVYAVDISGEMIRQAAEALRDRPNVHLFQNNGRDLRVLGSVRVDFAFSYIVFQHIPSDEIIYSYVREVHRLLRPGGLFKFQVQGDVIRFETSSEETSRADTWVGVPFSDAAAAAMAEACGFEPRHRHGAGTQYFWLWFFRRPGWRDLFSAGGLAHVLGCSLRRLAQ